MQNTFNDFPEKEELLEWYSMNGSNIIHNVNNHFHTPYSFSAFKDFKEVFEMAKKENIKILGINDFYTMEGYAEFHDLCAENSRFPCFNIEFIGLLKEEQKAGIRVNDPNNPGRCYISGKGLDFPSNLDGSSAKKLDILKKESAKQAELMLNLASDSLKAIDPNLTLDTNTVYKEFTQGMLRERHIAKAIREQIFKVYKDKTERKSILNKLFEGTDPKSDLENSAALENEIRSKLLKSGGIAYVQEDPKAFLELSEILKIIIDAGGIPTYPVLLDDNEGNYTEFEKYPQKLLNTLSSMNIFSLELIPGRNEFDNLKEFVRFFHDRNFVISFGTEHNTPEMIPLKVSAKNGIQLDEYLKRVSFEGVCVIAAHQFCRAKGIDSYIEKNGKVRHQQKDEFIELGNAVIEYFLQN